MRNFSFGMFLLMMCMASCGGDDQKEDVDLGYEYFPTRVGSYIIYEVDSVYHDQPDANIPGVHDTTHFFLKELMESEFTDNTGRSSIRLERYKADSLNGNWNLSDVWVVTKTSTRVEKVEENQRFIRLAFPVNISQQWNGNALNNMADWTYSYSNIGDEFLVSDTNFSSTVTVQQREVVNAVEDELAYEVYARDLGLIYKNFRDLDVRIGYQQNPVVNNIRAGREFTWKFVEHGHE